ncbi:type 4a pilus biogenesis protein PilO [Oceanospirillum linum]|uniref:Pilus assembly protein PilO n=1 Tax=Oceanospirillum linum TaxID=966 RepID=A0A1T1H8E0_OCELI|nr:type 4a pilus biogenesis protein PilO [Oceanospirillum linum]OOV86113.1 hypothetical protein BTA35_0215385 [Oceanospirillum linum]SEG42347.1 Tfp pilus assembly protein PilO [Oleiphilus messinensis]SMP33115.1 Tfp pilus assembly protein PilO [Oceanospirillum linum]
MPQINLLPWREVLRQKHQKQFSQQTLLVIFCTLFAILALGQFIEHRIDHQNKQNRFIQAETQKLDTQAQEAINLREKRNRLIQQVRATQNLQRHRGDLVRILNRISQATEAQLYLTHLRREGGTLTLEGEATDNQQISSLIRHLAQSEVLENPTLKNVGSSALNKGFHRFTIQVQHWKPGSAIQHEKQRGAAMTTSMPERKYPLKKLLEKLSQTDLTEIDFSSAGSWPKAGKVLAWILTAIITALPGYLLYLSPKFERLDQAGKHREQLLNVYETQASLVAYLAVYKRQLQNLQQRDHTQTSQIPTAKSIPQFMEQIGTQAQLHDVDLHTFKLGEEREHKIYHAQPITLTVKGSYHNLAQFLAAIAQLDRLTTLHDFRLQPSDNQLSLSIEIRVYHREQDNQQQGERHD